MKPTGRQPFLSVDNLPYHNIEPELGEDKHKKQELVITTAISLNTPHLKRWT
jgi:hypothetical protein